MLFTAVYFLVQQQWESYFDLKTSASERACNSKKMMYYLKNDKTGLTPFCFSGSYFS
jgi:hypothetical protein